jgi:hypothetical protein
MIPELCDPYHHHNAGFLSSWRAHRWKFHGAQISVGGKFSIIDGHYSTHHLRDAEAIIVVVAGSALFKSMV